MRRLTFAILASILTATELVAQDPDLKTIGREVRLALKQWDVPGTAVVIVRPDRVVLVEGYGVRELGRAETVGPDTIFPIASCTKSFTTAALAMLVDDGKLAWDDPVRKHLPGFHLADPHADALVTVRDLLCHRTGVGSHDYLWYRAPWGADEMIRRVGKLPLTGQFRSSFAYQSMMFMAAGEIIGRYDDTGWDGFVRRRLLQPLGMNSTFTTATTQPKKNNLARGHKRDRKGRVKAVDPYPMPEPNAAGSIHTNARDLGRWLQFQLSGGLAADGQRLVTAAGLGETHKPQNIIPSNEYTRAMNPESAQLTYAMGWVVTDYRGEKVLQHAGLIDGFRCQLTLLPERGYGIGLLNNLHATKMNLALANRLVDLLLGLTPKDWHGHYDAMQRAEDRASQREDERRAETRKQANKPTLQLNAYAGHYEHPAYGIAEVRRDGDRLVWQWAAFKRELQPFSGDTFELHDVILDWQDVTFVKGAGRVILMKALGVDFDKKD